MGEVGAYQQGGVVIIANAADEARAHIVIGDIAGILKNSDQDRAYLGIRLRNSKAPIMIGYKNVTDRERVYDDVADILLQHHF